MRQRLLDATIDCLVEHGYAGTTVTKIADRAGVTRGAQVHHYRTKAELVTAAIEHLANRLAEQTFADLSRLESSEDLIGDALEMIWQVHQGPVFAASVELWVAARTDPSLRDHVARLETTTIASLVDSGRKRLGAIADRPKYRHVVYTAMDVVRGILITSWAHPNADQLNARWRRAKERLRIMIEASLDRPS
ncbi:MAG: TetR family transcriptional regulator [Micromonosporaceae bacterium]|nr:TetR family transcriptional regulator [Micromonosporaceae bacterium]